MKLLSVLIFVTIVCALSNSAFAQGQVSSTSASLDDQLRNVFGDKEFEVSDHDDQLKAVVVDGTNFFVTLDGHYVFAGPVFDTRRQVDLVAEKAAMQRQTVLKDQPDTLFVRYPSSGDVKHELTVFTDIDCPYCRKLHNFMSDINQRGISVNYVMLPRAGVGSTSYIKTLNALCSDQPAESITQAMLNQNPRPASCETSRLDRQMMLARRLKINSTPTIVLPSGELRIGLIEPDQLFALLEREGK